MDLAVVVWSQNRHNGFFAGLIHHSKLHAAFLNVHDILRGIALCEDGFFSSKLANYSPQTGRNLVSVGCPTLG